LIDIDWTIVVIEKRYRKRLLEELVKRLELKVGDTLAGMMQEQVGEVLVIRFGSIKGKIDRIFEALMSLQRDLLRHEKTRIVLIDNEGLIH